MIFITWRELSAIRAAFPFSARWEWNISDLNLDLMVVSALIFQLSTQLGISNRLAVRTKLLPRWWWDDEVRVDVFLWAIRTRAICPCSGVSKNMGLEDCRFRIVGLVGGFSFPQAHNSTSILYSHSRRRGYITSLQWTSRQAAESRKVLPVASAKNINNEVCSHMFDTNWMSCNRKIDQNLPKTVLYKAVPWDVMACTQTLKGHAMEWREWFTDACFGYIMHMSSACPWGRTPGQPGRL